MYYYVKWLIILYHIIYKITVFYFIYFLNVIYSCDRKAEFSAVFTPVFSVTWSFRNFPSKIYDPSYYFVLKKHLLLSKLKAVVLLNVFGNHFRILLMNRNSIYWKYQSFVVFPLWSIFLNEYTFISLNKKILMTPNEHLNNENLLNVTWNNRNMGMS